MFNPRFLNLTLLALALALAPGLACLHTGPRATRVGAHLYVAPTGSDSATGKSPAQAFATLSRARDEIRRLKASGPLPSGGVAVEIAGGTYPVTESLALTAADSGTATSPIVYRASDSQPVKLLGGKVLPISALKPVTNPALLERLDPTARGQVVAAPIAALQLSHAGPFPPVFSDSGGILELFWNGQRQSLSRWPNEGWTTMKAAVLNGDIKTPGIFEYRDDRPSRWLKNSAIWLKGQWRVGWEDPAIQVASIDPVKKQITFATGIQKGIGNKYARDKKTDLGPGNGKEPWCALNLIEEIDRPGEWAIDFTSQTLFFWPPSAQGELMISQLDQPLISATGTSHVQFIGLTLEGSLGDGFVFEKVDSVRVAGCTVRNLAKNAVILNGVNSGVQDNDFYQLGAGCVLISGGDSKTLTPSKNYIYNNHFHHYGVLKAMYSAAIDLGSGGNPGGISLRDVVGVHVANNLIHDAPRDAILVSGQDHLFELNEVFRCGFASADVGAFYSWLDWTIRGVVVRHNYLHDTVGGVNPDDGASGFIVYGNVFVGPRSGVWIASGPDNTTEHNIFVKDEGPVFGLDDRGVGRGYATNPKLIKAVEAINPTQAPWATRFPEMVTLLADHPELPLRTRFTGNLIVMKTGEPVLNKLRKENKTDPRILIQADNLVTAEDPGFVDAAKGNFMLKPDAAVFSKIPGFKPIPFDQIGLRVDGYRKALPDDSVTRRPKPNAPEAGEEKNFGT